MGQVTVTLNGRAYRLSCGEGEEKRLLALADHVRDKLDLLVAQFGQAGNDRLMLMAALLIADELWDARARAGLSEPVGEPAGKAGGKPQKAAS